MTSVDLAVIGGGPAGLATAIQGRMAGFSVRLFDRAIPPIDKACGEGLMPDGVACLEGLGIEATALGRPFVGIRYLADSLVACGRFPQGGGLGIRRTRLHESLADRAEQIGAKIHWGCTVQGIEGHTVRTADGDFKADWIVGADGLHSRVRRWLGIRTRCGRPRFGVRRHYEVEPWSDLVEVYWGDGCEAYVTPVAEQRVGVAILRGRGEARFDALLARFPALEARLAGATPISRSRGWGALWAVPDTVMQGHVALVGDAAGYLDAITGEGLSLAFHESQALIRALLSGEPTAYPISVRKLMRWPGLLIRALLFIEQRPRLVRRLIRTLADDPQLFSRLLAVHAQQVRPHELGMVHAARLLRGLAGVR